MGMPASWLRLLLVCIGVSISDSLLFCNQALALTQGDTTITNVVSVQRSFSRSLSVVSDKWRVAIVAEAGPVKSYITLSQQQLKAMPGPDEALRQIAETYDYKLYKVGPVFCLIERYGDTNDLPNITLGEAKAALERINQLLAPFKVEFAPSGPIASARAVAIAQVLTADQLKSLETEGVPVRSLNAQQREQVWHFVENITLAGTVAEVQASAKHIGALYSQNPAFMRKKIDQAEEIGYELSYPDKPVSFFLPLSHPNTWRINDDGTVLPYAPTNNGTVAEPPADLRASSIGRSTAALKWMGDTLGSAVARLNSRIRQGNQLYKVQDYLTDKPVTIGGESYADRKQLAAALAHIYGLELSQVGQREVLICRGPSRPVTDTTSLQAAIISEIPGPVIRALTGRPIMDRADENGPEMHTVEANVNFAAQARQTIASAALASIVSDKLASNKVLRIHLADVGSDGAKLLADARALYGLSRALLFSKRTLPGYVTHFDDVVLRGGITVEQGIRRLEFMLEYRDPTTGSIQKGGIRMGIID